MAKRKRIGIYSPYIPEHFGGGERYIFSVAECASIHHDVVILVRSDIVERIFSAIPDQDVLRKRYEQAFHLNLSRVHFKFTSLGVRSHPLQIFRETLPYDVMYYLTDGSFFFSGARKNIVHIQFPFTTPICGVVERLKLHQWSTRNANSIFTKKVVEHAWKVPIQYVHYPFIDHEIFVPAKKEHIILSVGRFFTGEKSGLHCKRQDILVETFKTLIDMKVAQGWRLVLIGTVDPGEDNQKYAQQVAAAAKGYPIKILHDASFDVLRQYYSHASLYWHAAGFGIDSGKEPKKVEHFGISIVEAMSSGAIPIVIGKGGTPEIIDHGIQGFLCDTEDDIVKYSLTCMNNHVLTNKMRQEAREKAMQFNKDTFHKTLEEMI
ncbi:MAG: glycosyltransferase [Candidatus Pacebacteria bacterium]|nr:glycosyltransferase [Candidatus Paceibacterota bacterium]